LQTGVKEFNKGSFLLENESRIIASATSSDNIRGWMVNLLYIDECAFVEKFEEFFTSVYPTISSGKTTKIVMTSTPHGLNHFYSIVTKGKRKENEYNVIEVPWNKVPGRDKKWKAQTLAAMNGNQEKFDQEFGIEFLGSSGTLISGPKLRELVPKTPLVDKAELLQYSKPVPGDRYALVADVARGRGLDYSAFTIWNISKMPYDQVAVFRSNTITPVDYAEVIFRVAESYNEAMALIEVNDIGGQIADLLHMEYEYVNIVQTENKPFGKQISEGFGGKKTDKGIRTTKRVKNVGCSILKLLVEQDQMLIHDEETIYELSTFSKKGDSYEAEKGKHDDLAMTCVLFAWLSDQQWFKERTDINTLVELRDKTNEEIQADLAPFMVGDPLRDDEFRLDGDMSVEDMDKAIEGSF